MQQNILSSELAEIFEYLLAQNILSHNIWSEYLCCCWLCEFSEYFGYSESFGYFE